MNVLMVFFLILLQSTSKCDLNVVNRFVPWLFGVNSGCLSFILKFVWICLLAVTVLSSARRLIAGDPFWFYVLHAIFASVLIVNDAAKRTEGWWMFLCFFLDFASINKFSQVRFEGCESLFLSWTLFDFVICYGAFWFGSGIIGQRYNNNDTIVLRGDRIFL